MRTLLVGPSNEPPTSSPPTFALFALFHVHSLQFPARNACALYDLPESALNVTRVGSLLERKRATVLADIMSRYDLGLIA
jgi:hypothetical protein